MKFLRRESDREGRDSLEGRQPPKRILEPLREDIHPPPAPPAPVNEALPPAPVEPQVVPPPVPAAVSSITSQTPDNVIGATLVVQGRVEFQNLLRIDGHFEGELVGNGSLIIGPTAEVISNIRGLQEVYVEGILIGDCVCEKMQIRIAGCVTGNLQCASLGMDPSVVLKGSANVNPRDKTDKKKVKSRNGARHSRQQSQPRLSSDDNLSSRTPLSSMSGVSPDSVVWRPPGFDVENQSVLSDNAQVQSAKTGGQGENGAKGGNSNAKSKGNRRNSTGGNLNGVGTPKEGHQSGHRRIPSNENLPLTQANSPAEDAKAGGSNGIAGGIQRLGDAINLPLRSRPPVYGTR